MIKSTKKQIYTGCDVDYGDCIKKIVEYKVLLSKIQKAREEIALACKNAGVDCGINYLFPHLSIKINHKIRWLRKKIDKGSL